MRFETIEVTPQVASELLAASEHVMQRTYVQRRSERFAHDMRNGNWRVTHQPIAISPDGAVLDGQHRLHAVILADATVTMLVAYDIDPTTFAVIDTGTSRGTHDALKIAGIPNAGLKASVARQLLAYDAVVGTTLSLNHAARDLTTTDVQAVFDTPRGELIFAAEALGQRVSKAFGRFGLRSWTAVAWVIMEESELSDSVRAEFWQRFTDGAMLAPGSPILALRRWIMSETGLGGVTTHDRPAHVIANTIKAVNDYTLGLERQIVTWRQGREAMPRVINDVSLLNFDERHQVAEKRYRRGTRKEA